VKFLWQRFSAWQAQNIEEEEEEEEEEEYYYFIILLLLFYYSCHVFTPCGKVCCTVKKYGRKSGAPFPEACGNVTT
jgi:hypothetical protein